MLLKQLQPFYSQQNLLAAPPISNVTKQPLVMSRKGSGSVQPHTTKNQNLKKQMFKPDNEDGIARILNNINVIVQKPSDGTTHLPQIK